LTSLFYEDLTGPNELTLPKLLCAEKLWEGFEPPAFSLPWSLRGRKLFILFDVLGYPNPDIMLGGFLLLPTEGLELKLEPDLKPPKLMLSPVFLK
jgi:hypothetical protein